MYIKKEWKGLLFVFLASFLPRVLLCLNNLPLNSLPDELSTIAAAAQYAGKDWSEIVSTTRYYGTGFTSLFTPLFVLSDNPFFIYRCMMIICAMVQSFSAPIAYVIMNKYFDIKDRKYTIVSSIACSYMVVTYVTYVYNEHPMILCSWMIALLLILLVKYVDDKKKKTIFTVFLCLLLCYTLTLHTRSITYWIAFAILIALFYWGYRKWIVSLPITVSVCGIGYWLVQLYIKYSQSVVWDFNNDKIVSMGVKALEEGQEAYLHNAEISGLQYLEELTSVQSWPSFFNVIISQINNAVVVSVGFAVICIVITIYLIYRLIVRKKDEVFVSKSIEMQMLTSIAVFFTICIAVSIGGIAVTWLGQAMRAYASGMGGTKGYGYKAYNHIRYMGPYLGPILMLGLIYIYQYREKMKQLITACIWTFIFLQFYFASAVLPYIYRQQISSRFFVPFALQEYDQYGDMKRLLTYIPGILVACIVFVIILILIYKKKMLPIPIILATFLIYQYSYATIFFEGNSYHSGDSGYELVKQLEERIEVPLRIYVPNDDTYNSQAYMMQYLLNEYRISPDFPEIEVTEAMIFLNAYDPNVTGDLIGQGYLCAQLDDNEFIYVKGKDLQNEVMNCGIELQNKMSFSYCVDLRDFKSQNNVALFEHSFLETAGEEGYLVYGKKIDVSEGYFRFTIRLENKSQGEIGKYELWNEEICVSDVFINEDSVGKDYEIVLEGYAEEPMVLEPRLWTNSASCIIFKECKVESGL